MDAHVEIGEGASMGYQERNYHGPHGGVEVIPKAVVRIGTVAGTLRISPSPMAVWGASPSTMT